MMISIYRLGFLALVFVVMTTISAFAQTTPTPTTGPTKTPTLTPTQTAQEIPAATDTPFEPLTQADLNILTGNVQRPNGIMWHNDKLYVGCNGDFTIYEVDSRTGASAVYIYGVRNLHAMYVEDDTEGRLNLWIPDFQSNTFVRVTRTGVETVASGLQGPWGIAKFSDTNFAVSNLTGNNVVSINRTGAAREMITDLRSPTGIAASDDGFVYVANNGSARRAIEWFSSDELLGSEPISAEAPDHSLVTGLQNTTGLAIGADGLLYFAYSLGTRGVVGRIDPAACRENGGCTNDQVEIVLYTELAAPLAGLTLSPDMRLFVHTMFSPDIYWAQL